ncbi:MAG TPA: response regulator [Acidimicrobiia bacterium]|nr:response regulator [Acidimicrobiia bacterium]
MPNDQLNLRVLAADDDPDILDLISYRLERSGCEVLRAADGEAALDLARSDHPDLAVLDVMMPKMDGYEVTRQIKADPTTAGIKVILLTASAQEPDVVRGFQAGADDYMTKPFSPQELRMRLAAISARR